MSYPTSWRFAISDGEIVSLAGTRIAPSRVDARNAAMTARTMAREQMLRVQEEHREMYEAARTGDVDRATAAALLHREGNLSAWARIIEETTGEGPEQALQPAESAEGSTGNG